MIGPGEPGQIRRALARLVGEKRDRRARAEPAARRRAATRAAAARPARPLARPAIDLADRGLPVRPALVGVDAQWLARDAAHRVDRGLVAVEANLHLQDGKVGALAHLAPRDLGRVDPDRERRDRGRLRVEPEQTVERNREPLADPVVEGDVERGARGVLPAEHPEGRGQQRLEPPGIAGEHDRARGLEGLSGRRRRPRGSGRSALPRPARRRRHARNGRARCRGIRWTTSWSSRCRAGEPDDPLSRATRVPSLAPPRAERTGATSPSRASEAAGAGSP